MPSVQSFKFCFSDVKNIQINGVFTEAAFFVRLSKFYANYFELEGSLKRFQMSSRTFLKIFSLLCRLQFRRTNFKFGAKILFEKHFLVGIQI